MDLVSLTTLETLQTLRRQHHSLYPVYKLHLSSLDILARPETQQWLVERVLQDPVIRGKEPERGYERRFWRRVVQALEGGVEELQERGYQDAEVDERIYEHLTGLMVSSTPREDDLPGQSYRTFIYDLSPDDVEQKVTLLEEQMAIQGGTTGLRTWTASLHLGHYILKQPDVVFSSSSPSVFPSDPSSTQNRVLPPIVELGAGTGFLSVLLAQLGADVLSTDLGDTLEESDRQTPLARLRGNVELNGMEGSVQVSHLDWMDSLQPESERPKIWREAKGRTIIAADVIYDPDIVPALVNTIRGLLPASSLGSSGQAIIAATVRNEDTLEIFERVCEEQGMFVHRLQLEPVDPTHPTFWDSGMDEGAQVRIMKITKRDEG